jgi:hypothetical protein
LTARSQLLVGQGLNHPTALGVELSDPILSVPSRTHRNVKKSNISVESDPIFKNLVLQALGTIRFQFLQKSKKNGMLV